MGSAFDFLTDDDWALLMEKGETVDIKKDQVILEEGERRRALYVILEGSCRVEARSPGARRRRIASDSRSLIPDSPATILSHLRPRRMP